MQEGYGACLIDKPELLRDVVLQTKNRISSSDFSVSVKIRIHPDIRLHQKHLDRAFSSIFLNIL